MFAAPTPLCPFQKVGGKVLVLAFMAHCFNRFYPCGLWRGELPQPLTTTNCSVCRTNRDLRNRYIAHRDMSLSSSPLLVVGSANQHLHERIQRVLKALLLVI